MRNMKNREVTDKVTGYKMASRRSAMISNLVTRSAIGLCAALMIAAPAQAELVESYDAEAALVMEGYELPLDGEWIVDEEFAMIPDEIDSEAFEAAVDEINDMELGGDETADEAIETEETGLTVETEAVETEDTEVIEETEMFEEAEAPELIEEAPIEESWTEAVQAEPVHWIEKIAQVQGRSYCVVVRYRSDWGIPEDAELTAEEIADVDRYADCLHSAQDALENNGESVQDFYLLDLSLISNDVNYASTYRYEVEILMDEAIVAQPDDLHAMQFDGEGTTLLNTEGAVNAEDDVNRISFRPEAA